MNFNINENGVCVNAKEVFRAYKDRFNIYIKVGRSGKHWGVGSGYDYQTGGSGSPCCPDIDKFNSEEEAIESEIKRLKSSQYFEKGGACEWHLNELIKFEASIKQFKLF